MNSLTSYQLALMFHKVVDTCEKKLYDPKLNGVNLRHLAEERKDRILVAASDEELEREFNELIKELKVDQIRELIADGTITGGMIPKVETCIYAVERGVEGVVILDGKIPHAVLIELLTDHGAGTLITR